MSAPEIVYQLVEKFQQDNAEYQTTDNQIDRLVYALYGLSDDEIAIVEGKA